jgi:serine/threonine protein kinase
MGAGRQKPQLVDTIVDAVGEPGGFAGLSTAPGHLPTAPAHLVTRSGHRQTSPRHLAKGSARPELAAEQASRYELEARIGSGGMGDVWRAHDRRLGRVVAVKTLARAHALDREARARFAREARLMARLVHPGVATLHDYHTAGGDACIVMEFVDGEPLKALLRRAGSLPVRRTLEIVEQVALALDAVHAAGVVHRDVTPANLLVRRGDGRIKVTDFGIARSAPTRHREQGVVTGTYAYMSPEQIGGERTHPVTGASDVYSLGIVAYHCLSGRLPFPAEYPDALVRITQPPPPLPEPVPAPVRDLVERLLASDPAARPSARELAQAARALLDAPNL